MVTGSPMPVRATSSPKIALIKVDFPTPVLPKIARLKRPIAALLSNSVRNEFEPIRATNHSALSPIRCFKGTGAAVRPSHASWTQLDSPSLPAYH